MASTVEDGVLIVFGGLPGTGKSTLARSLARQRRAVWLRIDVIEQAIRDAGMADVGAAGYWVGYALARSNLAIGTAVVADSVNPVAATRNAWRDAARTTGVPVVEIEVVCSDLAEHRRRVERRGADVAGLRLPTWRDVQARHYETWAEPHLVIDTARRRTEDALAEIRRRMGGDGIEPPALSV